LVGGFRGRGGKKQLGGTKTPRGIIKSAKRHTPSGKSLKKRKGKKIGPNTSDAEGRGEIKTGRDSQKVLVGSTDFSTDGRPSG